MRRMSSNAVHPSDAEVGHHDIELTLLKQIPCVLAAERRLHTVSQIPQYRLPRLQSVGVVVDKEDSGGGETSVFMGPNELTER